MLINTSSHKMGFVFLGMSSKHWLSQLKGADRHKNRTWSRGATAEFLPLRG